MREIRSGVVVVCQFDPHEGGGLTVNRYGYGGFHLEDDTQVNDLISAIGLATDTRYVEAEQPTMTRIAIAEYVRTLRLTDQSKAGRAQLEAVADAILEQRHVNSPARESGGGTISCGPVTIDLDFCHRMHHTPEQIARLVDLCLTASKLEGKITGHREGRTRQCDVCENWTYPLPTKCHLCHPKAGSPTHSTHTPVRSKVDDF